jgi:hypothetical protein
MSNLTYKAATEETKHFFTQCPTCLEWLDIRDCHEIAFHARGHKPPPEKNPRLKKKK